MFYSTIRKSTQLIGLSFCLFSSISFAEELLLLSHHFPPYNFIQEDKFVGINTDIISQILEAEDIAFRIEDINWARAQQIVQSTPGTALLAAGRNAEREHKYAWVGPLVSSTPYLFKLSSRNDVSVKSLADLKFYRIALTRRGVMVPTFLKLGLSAPENLVFVAGAEETYGMLFQQRVDLIIGSDLTMPYNLHNLGYELNALEAAIQIDFKGAGNHLALHKSYSPERIERLNARIKKMWDSGEIDVIVDSYRLPVPPKPEKG